MDRLALSQRIKGLSDVFANTNPMSQDLAAMAYVLENMSDEKFANVLNSEYNSDKEAGVPALGQIGTGGQLAQPTLHNVQGGPALRTIQQWAEEQLQGKLTKEQAFDNILKALKIMPTPAAAPAPAPMRLASEMFWSKEASEAIQNYLVKDVVGMDKSIKDDSGMRLPKEQLADATKTQTTPATLKKEQTPHLSEALDSKIVEKAKAAKPVAKDAGNAEMITCPDCDGKVLKATGYCLSCKKKIGDSKKDEDKKEDPKKEDKKEDKKEEPKKDDDNKKEAGMPSWLKNIKKEDKKDEKGDKKDEKKDSKKDKDASESDESLISSEGIELVAPMSEVKMSSEDEDLLSKLFA